MEIAIEVTYNHSPIRFLVDLNRMEDTFDNTLEEVIGAENVKKEGEVYGQKLREIFTQRLEEEPLHI